MCEDNWFSRIAGVRTQKKRVARRKMDDLREELCMQKYLMGRLVERGIKWAGHVERMGKECLPRMA